MYSFSSTSVHRLPVFDLIHMTKNISSHIIAGSACVCVCVCPTFSLSKLGQASSLLGAYHTVCSNTDSNGHRATGVCFLFIFLCLDSGLFFFPSLLYFPDCDSFLYFYHLWNNSNNERGLATIIWYTFLKTFSTASLCVVCSYLDCLGRVRPGTSRHCWITPHLKKKTMT